MPTEPNFNDCTCPYCGKSVSFLEERRGMLEECPDCLESLVVPRESGQLAQKVPVPFATPRLMLRRLELSDGQDLLEFLSDEELFRFADRGVANEEQIQRWLEADQLVKLTSPDTVFCLGMAIQSTGKLIGVVYLQLKDETRSQAHISVYVHRGHQRQGLATEAVKGVCGFCFGGIGLHRVTARCDSRNVAARKLCEKVGMRCEGEFVQDHVSNDEWASTLWYAVLEEEHRA